jgi:hypothetical protein
MDEKDIKKLLLSLKEKTKPTEEFAQRIVASLEIREKEKGRLSGYELILNQIHNLMTKWKFVVPAAIVVLLVVAWGIVKLGPKGNVPVSTTEQEKTTAQQEQTITEQYVQVPPEISVPKADGQIDSTIDALMALSANEQTTIVEEGNDASIVTIDSQAVSDFGQSYNENQF